MQINYIKPNLLSKNNGRNQSPLQAKTYLKTYLKNEIAQQASERVYADDDRAGLPRWS